MALDHGWPLWFFALCLSSQSINRMCSMPLSQQACLAPHAPSAHVVNREAMDANATTLSLFQTQQSPSLRILTDILFALPTHQQLPPPPNKPTPPTFPTPPLPNAPRPPPLPVRTLLLDQQLGPAPRLPPTPPQPTADAPKRPRQEDERDAAQGRDHGRQQRQRRHVAAVAAERFGAQLEALGGGLAADVGVRQGEQDGGGQGAGGGGEGDAC
ncbi:uncharacterized protein IWZ02DRAFT_435036 [Phyllosticta citriasiana]|uniref:uncharacterized protein n=1 Tax=Phyllosticta citriasiana TaxID=595635 RepID=UPI0030FD4CC1